MPQICPSLVGIGNVVDPTSPQNRGQFVHFKLENWVRLGLVKLVRLVR